MRSPTPSIVPTFAVLETDHCILSGGGRFVAVRLITAIFAVTVWADAKSMRPSVRYIDTELAWTTPRELCAGGIA